MILYLDTETTGLYPGQICQLSYIMQDKQKVQAKNYFFAVDNVEYGAYMVHGFSKEKLDKLSGGKSFFDHFCEIEKDILSAEVVVCHNVNFDFMFLRAEFERCGKDFLYKNDFCTMKKLTPVCKLSRSKNSGYKYPKLSEACAFFGITDTEIKSDVKRFFGEETDFHDARFDTTALYLIANYGMGNGMEELKNYL